uniref:baseplate J/gp47 family protein n=1 Tax=Brachyspira catarrhinii TaxID=2528966 RepID=UPI003F4BEEBA
MKSIPPIKDIKNNMLSAVNTEIYSNKADSTMLERSVWNILFTAIAGVFRSLYEYARDKYRQIFTATADLNSLELRGQQYGIYRKKGKYTIILIRITGKEGISIPQNTQLIKDDYIYLTNIKADLDVGGEAEVEATATIIGNSTVLQADDILDFISPIADVNSSVIVIKTIENGENEEDVESFRNRIQVFERTRPQGGAVPDFIAWTLEVPEIVGAMIIPVQKVNDPVKVYPIADEKTGSRIPDEEKIQEVLNYLSDDKRRPPCLIEVYPPKELSINITVRNLSPYSEASKKRLEDVWNTYLRKKRPKQYTNQEEADNLISSSTLISMALSSADIKDLLITKITIEELPAEAIPYTLKLSELAKLGTVTYE